MELWQYDATDLARLIRTGRASAREAVDSVLARLHKVNPAINAVVRVSRGRGARRRRDRRRRPRARPCAAAAARRAGHDQDQCRSQPGMPTDNGVVPLKDFIAKEDSPVVANLKHAGAIIVGRTNAPAFSMRIFTDNALHGRTLNPLDPTRDAGRLERRRGRGDRHRHRRRSRMATTSAARSAFPPIATAWSACAPGFGRIPSLNPRRAAPAGRSARC